MRLNHTLGELNDNNFEEYGEWLYHVTVMGTPSATEPWGWQFDGHHAVINYFVLGDQVVMTPFFTGSEPATAAAGKYKGTTILRDEQQRALAFVNGLADAQRAKAILSFSKTGNDILTEAWKDNVVLDYAGLRATELTEPQRRQLLDLVALVRRQHGRRPRARADGRSAAAPRPDLVRVDRQDRARQRLLLPHPQPGHPDRVRSQPRRRTCGTWRRIRRRPTSSTSTPIVRTPNGNDYGKDLLRQHYLLPPALSELPVTARR